MHTLVDDLLKGGTSHLRLRMFSGEQHIEQDPQGVDIAAGIALMKTVLLRRDIARCAEMGGIVLYPGIVEASRIKVDEFDNAIISEHHIAGRQQLYAKNNRDAIIIYAISNDLNVSETNELLFEKGESVLD